MSNVNRRNIDPALVARGEKNPINRDASDVFVYYNTETNKYVKSFSFVPNEPIKITWTDDIHEAETIITTLGTWEHAQAKAKEWNKSFFGGLKVDLRRMTDFT